MKQIAVHSTKYDGSIHYRYPATLVRAEPNLLMLYGAPGTLLESYRGPLRASAHTLELYWSDRFYNLLVLWHENWQPRMHYVNIATPATWDTGVLHFIDLDLDVIWDAALNTIVVDDEDEFMLHQARFGYPAELVAQARQSSDEVRTMIAQRVYPFDGSLHAWRPDASP